MMNVSDLASGGGDMRTSSPASSGSLRVLKQLRHAAAAITLIFVIGFVAYDGGESIDKRRHVVESLPLVASLTNQMTNASPEKHGVVRLNEMRTKSSLEGSGKQSNRILKSTKVVPAALPITAAPTAAPILLPVDSTTGVTTFYVMGDTPYDTTATSTSSTQLTYLRNQVKNLPSDAEFFVHVGDIKSGVDTGCGSNYYNIVADALAQSRVPVFLAIGDNEWNDCSKPNDAWTKWAGKFMFFENKWTHDFKVIRMPGRNETFAFVRKGTLFMGFNIVGGRIHNSTEWGIRLSTQAQWAMKVIRYYDTVTDIGRIVMFAHADPTSSHKKFYDPFKSFVVNELKNRIPILHINGDGHAWKYQTTFFGSATSMLRVMVSGKATRPAHKMVVNATGSSATFSQAFTCVY